MTDGKKTYNVGYGKPPAKNRFKKGTSGNTKGRPKGARGLKTDLQEELGSRVRVTENGKTKTYTKQQVVVKQLTEKAVKGDMRGIKNLVDLILTVLGPEGDAAKSGIAVSAGDREIINQAMERMSHVPPQEGTGEDHNDT